ncbi:hypothetical protein [Pedobacter foliorum]|uniref:hypothetical protein n=1 Tax=Pedobacter foliorum TaxID=2739058 RepID=UPI0015654F27|nr:hypothetical protein [Pedobacter foliorum]NRF39164.1 hypothetical protein [Pedobacter foliorum]
MNRSILIIFCLILLNSCTKDVRNQVEVYSNDFEQSDLENILNGVLTTYNNTRVIGRYNNGGFSLSLKDLPKHDLVEVTFDLYIHDSWDGNQNKDNIDGPDIWRLIIDEKEYINTTFSNNPCITGQACIPQSYPNDYPNYNNVSRQGAYRINLPGVCHNVGGTTLYKIKKNFSHSKSSLLMQCLDKLVQTNSDDPLCDESWSVDNIKVKVISL